jgi:Holliday junction DNA helicase RuvA
MISFLRGRVEEKQEDYIDLNVNSVGYRVYMSKPSIEKIEEDKEVKVLTYMRVLQDDVSLFGFLNKEEKNMFELLLSVGGVGAKTAIQILGNISPSSFALAIISNDQNSLKKLPGIGPKTAGRIILELKDKIKTEQANSSDDVKEIKNKVDISDDLVEALIVLGYKRYQINEILPKIKETELENQIREALTYLANI